MSAGSPRWPAPRRGPTRGILLPLTLLLLAGCGSPREATIAEIQGDGHISPLADEAVVTAGVVTAVRGSELFVQDPEGDGRIATSDAVVVSADAVGASPAVAERIRVTGTVREVRPGGPGSGNLTVTTVEAGGIEVLDRGAPLPPPVRLATGGRVPPARVVIGDDELPVDLSDPGEAAANEFDPASEGIDFYESLEGMRVAVPGPVAVAPTEVFGEGGSGGAEIFTVAEGGAHVAPGGARTVHGGIRLQPHPENRGDQNPERIQLHFDPAVSPGEPPVVAVGRRLGDATGVMGYSYGNFEVVVTAGAEPGPGGAEPGATTLRGDDASVTVATYNVLNLNPLPETARRRALLGEQIAGALGAPAVVALQEIQDANGTRGGEDDRETDATATLEALRDVVVAAGGPRYAFVDVAPAPNASGGVPGGNIRNAFLYDPARVELVAHRSLGPGALAEAGAPDPGAFDGARRPLAATFTFRGRRFTVVSNHWTSRAGSTPIFGAVQPFVQAGEAARESQALALHAWVARALEADPEARIVVAGDLNTFEFTDDLSALLPSGGPPGDGGPGILENVLAALPPETRYTYVYEGNAQALDHVYVTRSLAAGVRAEAVHVNADFPEGVRASDHDPVVVRLELGG